VQLLAEQEESSIVYSMIYACCEERGIPILPPRSFDSFQVFSEGAGTVLKAHQEELACLEKL